MEVLQANKDFRIDNVIIFFCVVRLIEPNVCKAFLSCWAVLGLRYKHLFKQAFQFVAEAWYNLVITCFDLIEDFPTAASSVG